jgi:hypothetical protein
MVQRDMAGDPRRYTADFGCFPLNGISEDQGFNPRISSDKRGRL